jgi:hypothetical protein
VCVQQLERHEDKGDNVKLPSDKVASPILRPIGQSGTIIERSGSVS